MKQKESFLVFSDDWGEHPSSCQHIFKYIVQEHPVIWVNTVGMRMPRLNRADLTKGLRKIRKMFVTSAKKQPGPSLPPNLSVLQPFMIPYNKGVLRSFNREMVVHTVRAEFKRRGFQSPILISTVPNACDYVGAFGERRVVYYCVDDFAHWPGHEKELILEMEKKLIAKSDVFIVVSELLKQKLQQKTRKQIHLLTHGVDFSLFKNAKPDNSLFKDVLHPRIGYTGLIWERLNLELLKILLKKFPKFSFIFVGKKDTDITVLEKFSNFYYFPPQPAFRIPGILKALDILILPYCMDPGTLTANPLKLKEYLVSGVPVVGVPLPEIKKFAPFVHLARTPEEWVAAIKWITHGEKRANYSQELLDLLAKEDWAFKAQEFLKMVTT